MEPVEVVSAVSARGRSYQGLPAPVLAEYGRAAPEVAALLSSAAFTAWAEAGARLARETGGAGQVAVEYLRVSPAMLRQRPRLPLEPWVSAGLELGQASIDLGAAYFRTSPAVLARLEPEQLPAWAAYALRLHHGGWQSGSLAVELLEQSPRLLEVLDLELLGQLAALLGRVAASWNPTARQCLTIVLDLLPELPAACWRPVLSGGAALARRGAPEAREWLSRIAAALHGLDPELAGPLLGLAVTLAEEEASSRDVLGFLAMARQRMAAVDRAGGRLILEQVPEIRRVSAAAAREFVLTAPGLLERLDAAGLRQWVAAGLALAHEKDGALLGYFRRESARALDEMRRLSRGVELSSVTGMLRLYCTAIAGTEVQVLPTSELVQKGIGWTAERRPTTEGSSIYLPEVVQAGSDRQENFEALKVYALHQAGHLEFDSFGFDFDRPGAVFPRRRGAVERARRRPRSGTRARDPESARPEPAEGRTGADSEEMRGLRGSPRAGAGAGQRVSPASGLDRFFALFEERLLAHDLFTILEDVRVDGRLLREYSGIRRALRRVQQEERERRPDAGALPDAAALVEALLQRSLSPDPPPALAPHLQPTLEQAWAYAARLLQSGAMVEDTAEATLRCYLLVRAAPEVPDLPDEDLAAEQPPLEEGAADRETMPLDSSAGAAMGDLFNELDSGSMEGEYRSPEPVDYRGDFKPQLVQAIMKLREDAGASGERSVSPATMEELQQLLERLDEIELSDLMAADLPATSGMFVNNLLRETGHQDEQRAPRLQAGAGDGPLQRHGSDEFLYAEWDFRSGAYRADWCLVHEKVLPRGTARYYDQVLAEHAPLARAVRRQFEMLKPELFKKLKHLADGEEFDLDDVIAAVVDRRAGQPPSEKLYARRNKEERSVAVALLLDLSASTDEDARKTPKVYEEWPDWDTDSDRYMVFMRDRIRAQQVSRRERRRIIDVERESAVLLVQALETLGDTYGVYGFSGYGRDSVEFFVLKDLREPLSDLVKARVSNMEPVRGTRMGAAIRHATAKLDAWDARLKVLLLVSDGRPQDHDYGRDRTEKEYAYQDTRKALLEARQKRIVPFSLTVDPEGHDYMRSICEGMGYEVLDDIEALPRRLPALYRRLTF